MKRLCIVIISLLMLVFAGSLLKNETKVEAEESLTNISTNTIIDGNIDSEYSNIDTALFISDSSNVTLKNCTISALITIEEGSTVLLQNVNFLSTQVIDSFVCNYGKLIIDNCSFAGKRTVDIINNSKSPASLILHTVTSAQSIKIRLDNNYVYVDKESQIDGQIELSLKDLSYDYISESEDDFVGKVLVRGIDTFAGRFIKQFKFLGAPDENSLGVDFEECYFESLIDKYYLDYAGVLNYDQNISDGIYAQEADNIIYSGDIILTKYSVKISAKNISEDYDDFKYEDANGTQYIYIGGKYATARLFVETLKSYSLDNLCVIGNVVSKQVESTKVDENLSSCNFILDEVSALVDKYVYCGEQSFEKFFLYSYLDDEKTNTSKIYICQPKIVNNETFAFKTLLSVQLDSQNLQIDSDNYFYYPICQNENVETGVLSFGKDGVSCLSVDVRLVSITSSTEVEVFVDENNFEYDGTNKCNTSIVDNCYPYYLNGDTKVYLPLSDVSIFKKDNQTDAIDEIKNAGNYIIKVSSSSENIIYLTDSFDIVVTPRVLQIDYGETVVEYNGSTQTITPVIKNKVVGDDISLLTRSSSLEMKNPNTYQITILIDNCEDRANYTFASGNSEVVNFQIVKKKLDLSEIGFDDIHHTYDKTKVSIANVIEEVLDRLPIEISRKPLISGDSNLKNAGSYPISVTFKLNEGAGYKYDCYDLIDNVKTFNVIISKADFDIDSIVFDDQVIEYDGKYHCLSYNENQYTDIVTLQCSPKSYSTCGTYTETLVVEVNNDNYNYWKKEKYASLIIKQKTIDMKNVVFEDKELEYDGKSYSIEACGLDPLIKASYTYYLNEQKLDGVSAVSNAGTYTIEAHFEGIGDAYNNIRPIDNMSATLTIKKKVIDYAKIVFLDKKVTYNGSEQSHMEITSPYNFTFDFENATHTNAGNYVVTASLCLDDNYEVKNFREIKAELIIEKASYDMSKIKFTGISCTYDGVFHTATISGTLPKGVTCKYSNNSFKDAGLYTAVVMFTVDDPDNYEEIEDKTCIIEIKKKPLTLALVQDKFEYTGSEIYVEAEIKEGLIVGDSCSVGLSINNMINAGSYDAKYILSNNNYKPSSTTCKYTIKKATMDMSKISFEDIEVEYDGKVHNPQLVGTIPDGIVVNVASKNIVDVGEYVVYADFTVINNNYNKPSRISAKVKINPKPVLVEFSGYSLLVEDGTQKEIKANFLNVLENDFDDYSLVYSSEPILAGKYTVKVVMKDNSNYEIVGSDSLDFEIMSKSKTYIGSNISLQIDGDYFPASAEVSVDTISDDSVSSKLDELGVTAKNTQAFTIKMSGVDKKEINVAIQKNSLQVSDFDNVKIYKLKNNELVEINYYLDANAIKFSAYVDDEIVIVEEKTFMEKNTWIYIFAISIAVLSITAICLWKFLPRKKKQIEHFIDD